MPIISHQRSCGKLCFAGSEWPCHLQHGDYNPLFLIPLRQASSWCFPICILSRFWQSVTSPSLDPLTETWTAKMGRSHFCPLDGSPCRRPVAVLLLRVSLFLLLVGFDLVIWVARFLLMQSLVSLNHFPFLEKKSSTAAAGGFLSSPPCRGKSFMENYRWVKLEALTWTLVDFFTKLPFSTPKKTKKKIRFFLCSGELVFSMVITNDVPNCHFLDSFDLLFQSFLSGPLLLVYSCGSDWLIPLYTGWTGSGIPRQGQPSVIDLSPQILFFAAYQTFFFF